MEILEKEMATHSSILVWRIPPMNREAWWATACGITKELDVKEATKQQQMGIWCMTQELKQGLCNNLEGEEDGRDLQDAGDIADSCGYSAETNEIL